MESPRGTMWPLQAFCGGDLVWAQFLKLELPCQLAWHSLYPSDGRFFSVYTQRWGKSPFTGSWVSGRSCGTCGPLQARLCAVVPTLSRGLTGAESHGFHPQSALKPSFSWRQGCMSSPDATRAQQRHVAPWTRTLSLSCMLSHTHVLSPPMNLNGV